MKKTWSGKPYRETVVAAIKVSNSNTVLDIACGDGWLKNFLGHETIVDGVDLFNNPPLGYRKFYQCDINNGLPKSISNAYDAAVCCEAIAYLENPIDFLRNVHQHLRPGGKVIISTPNPGYIGARLYFLLRGYLPSFSHFVQNKKMVSHMPWHALGWPQLWFILGRSGFTEIQLLDVDE